MANLVKLHVLNELPSAGKPAYLVSMEKWSSPWFFITIKLFSPPHSAKLLVLLCVPNKREIFYLGVSVMGRLQSSCVKS